VLEHLYHIGISVFLNLTCFLTGYLFLPRVKLPLLLRMILSIGIGYIVIGITLFLAGTFQLLLPQVIFFLWGFYFFLPLIVKRRAILQEGLNFGRKFLEVSKKERLILIPLLFIFYFSLSHFFRAEIPIYHNDTYQYHLEGLKIFAQERGFKYIPQNIRVNMPFQAELYQIIGLFLNDIRIAFSIQASFTLLLSLGIIVFTYQKTRSPFLSLLSGAIFLGLPMIRHQTGILTVEIFLGFFLFLSFIFFDLFITTREQKWLIFAGGFGGFSVGIKLLAFQLLVAYAFLFGIEFFTQPKKKVVFQSAIIFFSTYILLAAPWLIKSYLLTGNPCYPYYYSLFGGYGNAFSEAYHQALNRNVWNIPFTPGQFFRSFITFCYPEYRISPIMLFFPFLFLRRRARNELYLLSAYLISFFTWWWMCRLPRYGIYTIPFFLSLIFLGIHNISLLKLPSQLITLMKRGIYFLLILFLLFYSKQHLVTSISQGLKVIMNKEEKEKLYQAWPTYQMSQYLNENFGENVRVAGYNDYFLKGWNISFHPTSQSLFDYTQIKDARALEARLKALNIDVVVFFEKPQPEPSFEWKVVPEMNEREKKLQKIFYTFFKEAHRKYKVKKLPFGYIILLKNF
jgi:hypothetical protein